MKRLFRLVRFNSRYWDYLVTFSFSAFIEMVWIIADFMSDMFCYSIRIFGACQVTAKLRARTRVIV